MTRTIKSFNRPGGSNDIETPLQEIEMTRQADFDLLIGKILPYTLGVASQRPLGEIDDDIRDYVAYARGEVTKLLDLLKQDSLGLLDQVIIEDNLKEYVRKAMNSNQES